MDKQTGKQRQEGIYERVTGNVIELLEWDVKLWTQPWAAGEGCDMPLRHNRLGYRGINVLTLWAEALDAGYAERYWTIYHQSQGAGRRGGHGTFARSHRPR